MFHSRARAIAATLSLGALLIGCTETAAPGSEAASAPGQPDAEAVFREFNDAVNAGDAAAAAALVADDAEFFGQAAADVGIDGVVASVACTADVVSADVDGDTATIELELTGIAPLAEAADCPVGMAQTARVVVRDGKIVELANAE